jgi:hypothetical protein
MFAEILTQAKTQNTLPPQLDINAAAKTLQVNIIGWRSYLKATGDRVTIEKQLESIFLQMSESFH